jgi:hypothetical protein
VSPSTARGFRGADSVEHLEIQRLEVMEVLKVPRVGHANARDQLNTDAELRGRCRCGPSVDFTSVVFRESSVPSVFPW